MIIDIRDEEINRVASLVGKTVQEIEAGIKEAICEYLEDEEGLFIAEQRLSDPDQEFFTLEEVRKELGLEDHLRKAS